MVFMRQILSKIIAYPSEKGGYNTKNQTPTVLIIIAYPSEKGAIASVAVVLVL